MTFANPNITEISQLATYANTVTNDLFWNGFLLTLWIILFLAQKGYRSEAAVTSASFVCAIVAFLLSLLGLVNPTWIIGFTLATAASVFFL